MLVVGTDVSTSAIAVALAERYADMGVYAAVGIHPHDAKTVPFGIPSELFVLAANPRVVSIGEAGLDYFYLHSPRDAQKSVFKAQLEWAVKVQKPLTLHIRSGNKSSDAMDDAMEMLGSYSCLPPLLFHCYAGGTEYLNDVLSLPAYISIGGPVTWPKSDALREVAKLIPADRLLCETDAPWLTPAPYRGKVNEPAYVRLVYESIAKLRETSAPALANAVAANAARLFRW